MDFKTVALVLAVYFIRPQDWFTPLIGVGIVSPIMIVAIAAMISRTRKDNRPVTLMHSPMDWAMLAYYAYIAYTSNDMVGTLKSAFPLFAFYYVTVQALDTPERLRQYMKVWVWSVFTLAAIGMLQVYGMDITDGQRLTDWYQGRLALGTWMHDNPNALGHTVFSIIPLAYFLYFWRKGVVSKMVAVCIWVVAFLTILETQSKGAVLAGFVTLVLAFAFEQHRIVQILTLVVAFAGGGAIMSIMPRMNQMSSLRSDEGVQGRLMAWEQARMVPRNDPTGQGWKTFIATIKWEKEWVIKATHSSFVRVGAELGYYGMFLYVSILWLGLRALSRGTAENEDLERARRCLFVLLASYAISNWMIDRAYHTEFFLFSAAICALYRMQWQGGGAEGSIGEGAERVPRTLAGGTFPASPVLGFQSNSQDSISTHSEKKSLRTEYPGVVDIFVSVAATWAVFSFWDYILENL